MCQGSFVLDSGDTAGRRGDRGVPCSPELQSEGLGEGWLHNRKTQSTDQQEWRMAGRRTSEIGPEEALGGVRIMEDKKGKY